MGEDGGNEGSPKKSLEVFWEFFGGGMGMIFDPFSSFLLSLPRGTVDDDHTA